MFQSRDPRQSTAEQDTGYAYLEDMDMYSDGFEEQNQWFPWVAALGLGGACVGIGLAFSWLMSPIPSTSLRDRNPEPIATAQTEGDRDNPASSTTISGSDSRDLDRSFDLEGSRASTSSSSQATDGEEDGPLGISLAELPLIPVDPAATSRVRSSHISADLRATDESPSRPARDSELLTRDGDIALNPNLRQDELWETPESSQEPAPRQFFVDDSAAEELVAERHLNRDDRDGDARDRANDARRDSDRRDGDRELVENTNVAVARTTSPRLDLGPSLGEGSYLVLMAYQGDDSLLQARKYARGAFIKHLDGETYVQLAAFDQIEYARHMADNLSNQGVAVLILQ